MDWTITEGYGIPIGSSFAHGAPKEVSLMSFTLHLYSITPTVCSSFDPRCFT